MKQTQNDAILKYLRTGRSLTSLVALRMFGCLRLAARVYDLRHDGHRINQRPLKVGGKRVSVYSLP